jgi:aryl-alcohol dehydrogenase-like predicted oxidoreductase
MNKRRLGYSGLWVSEIGLGTNNFGLRDDVDAAAVVTEALDRGINFFDTAESYGKGKSESALGHALGARRHEAVIASKWGSSLNPPLGMGSRAYIIAACERSLGRLRTDYIDLYQLHAPDPHTPVEETIRACDDLVRQGKIRYYGLSNSPAWRMTEAQLTARLLGAAPFISTQDHYSLLRRDIVEGERLTVMQQYNISLLPYFPLAGGLLTGKYDRSKSFPEGSRFAVLKELSRAFNTERMWVAAEALGHFAQERGHSILELAFSWLLHRPAVASVTAGATTPQQVIANIQAAQWRLSPGEMDSIDRMTLPGPVGGASP